MTKNRWEVLRDQFSAVASSGWCIPHLLVTVPRARQKELEASDGFRRMATNVSPVSSANSIEFEYDSAAERLLFEWWSAKSPEGQPHVLRLFMQLIDESAMQLNWHQAGPAAEIITPRSRWVAAVHHLLRPSPRTFRYVAKGLPHIPLTMNMAGDLEINGKKPSVARIDAVQRDYFRDWLDFNDGDEREFSFGVLGVWGDQEEDVVSYSIVENLALASALVCADLQDRAQVPSGPSLSDSEKYYLQALHELGAMDVSSQETSASVVARAFGADADKNSYTNVTTDPKKKKYVITTRGAKGGCYLTQEGRLVAENLRDFKRSQMLGKV